MAASLTPLDPAPVAQRPPFDFVATEAGRTKDGVVATVQVLDGAAVKYARVVRLADPVDRRAFATEIADGATLTMEDAASALLELLPAVEGALRQQASRRRSKGTVSSSDIGFTAQEAGQDQATGAVEDQQDGSVIDADEAVHRTDLGNARRLVAQHGQDLRYCHPWAKWLCWDGTRWKKDESGEVVRRAKATVGAIYIEAAASPDSGFREATAKHAIKSEAEARIMGMITLAESEPGIPVSPDELDEDRWLLNVQNGTLDLHTLELRPHRREDLITKLAPVAYDPTAKADTWIRFLDQIMGGNQGMVRFLQRASGYSLTGVTSERVMFIAYGNGRNGKSTFIETLASLEGGDYALRTPTKTLMAKREEGIPNDVARLKGIRFTFATEPGEGKRLDEEMIKTMTGGSDTMTARFMRGEYFDFKPQFKLWLSTNHKPVIKGTDNGIWDKIRLIPFTVRFWKSEEAQEQGLTLAPEQIADPELPDRLKAEWPGILAWAVEGLRAFLKDGLGTPKEVREATNKYRADMDVIGRFFNECCIVQVKAKVTAQQLYSAYRQWCGANKEWAQRLKVFGDALVERGIQRHRGAAGRAEWLGIGLLAEAADPHQGGQSKGGASAKDSRSDRGDRGDPDSAFSHSNFSSREGTGKNDHPDHLDHSAGDGGPRRTRCHSCGQALDGATAPPCVHCGWLICPDCGACDPACGQGEAGEDDPEEYEEALV